MNCCYFVKDMRNYTFILAPSIRMIDMLESIVKSTGDSRMSYHDNLLYSDLDYRCSWKKR